MLNFFVTEYLYLIFGAGIGAKEPVERHMGWSIVAVEVGVVQQVVVVAAPRPLRKEKKKKTTDMAAAILNWPPK